jgi:hypothetical protein
VIVMKGRLSSLCFLAVAVVFAARPAWAYIDPSAGSYLLQILAAGLFGAMFALKVFWQRIKSFFSRRRPEETPTSGPDESDASP